MTLESKENYPRHTKIVQNSLGFMPEVRPLHKPCGDLVLCAPLKAPESCQNIIIFPHFVKNLISLKHHT